MESSSSRPVADVQDVVENKASWAVKLVTVGLMDEGVTLDELGFISVSVVDGDGILVEEDVLLSARVVSGAVVSADGFACPTKYAVDR